jgi:hypothetical protein
LPVDLEGDGDVDLVMVNVEGPARIIENRTLDPERPRDDRAPHWLEIRALDPALGREARGAKVTVRAQGRSWVRHLLPPGGYLSSAPARAHFGLGEVTEIEAVEVRWLDGTVERYAVRSLAGMDAVAQSAGPAVDQRLELVRGEGMP